jgi:hypothetical protein
LKKKIQFLASDVMEAKSTGKVYLAEDAMVLELLTTSSSLNS